MTSSSDLKGGEIIAQSLHKHGVTSVFSLAGTAHTYLLQA
ncbi:MAG: hypothetical protein JWO28_121, partial [Hyphomicrobiales bacterium]|nr:hypothetical protein [Hyphomicrobiales bacterium]